MKKKCLLTFVISSLLLSITIIYLCFSLGYEHKYVQIGPNKHFYVLGIIIDNWNKYIIYIIIISIIGLFDVISYDYVYPHLFLRIYDDDKVIKDYGTKNKPQGNLLIFIALGSYLSTNFRILLRTLIIISQIDVALIDLVWREVISTVILYKKVREKEKKGLFNDDNELLNKEFT